MSKYNPEYWREYYAKNKESRMEAWRNYYHRNKDKIKARLATKPKRKHSNPVRNYWVTLARKDREMLELAKYCMRRPEVLIAVATAHFGAIHQRQINTQREWKARNREHMNLRQREWRLNKTTSELREAEAACRRNPAVLIAILAHEWSGRPASMVESRIRRNIRSNIKNAIAGRRSAYRRITELLGCDIATVKRHLEAQFKPGMSWGNYGEWHIDHWAPLNAFELTIEKEIRTACHYTNLRPLWALENTVKKDRVDLSNPPPAYTQF
jgi:ribosomal protein L33